MVPVPLKLFVLVDDVTAAPPAVVVVVLLVCADTVAMATAQIAPAANIFIHLVCVIIVLCFG